MTTDSERAYLRELRHYVKALRKLLAITGPDNEPPGFAAEIAAGDPWTEDEVFTYWDALIAALNAFPQDHHQMPDTSGDVESWVGPAQLWLKNRGRLLASIRVLLRVCDEWQLPIKEGGTKGVWEIGTYEFDAPRVRFQGETDWRPIVAPRIRKEDHATLTWACDAMERLADDAEQDEIQAEGEQAPPLAKARQTRLVAHLDDDPPVITLDGKTVEAFDPVVTRYVAELIELNGGRKSAAEFIAANPACEGINATRFLDEIHNEILTYIARVKGTIPRLKTEELL